jgi:protein SCO1/2
VYYRGAITREMGKNNYGEEEQISVLQEDIQKLLQE